MQWPPALDRSLPGRALEFFRVWEPMTVSVPLLGEGRVAFGGFSARGWGRAEERAPPDRLWGASGAPKHLARRTESITPVVKPAWLYYRARRTHGFCR